MNQQIKQALTKLFERHRIVFWYDTEKELRSDFERLELENIESDDWKSDSDKPIEVFKKH